MGTVYGVERVISKERLTADSGEWEKCDQSSNSSSSICKLAAPDPSPACLVFIWLILKVCTIFIKNKKEKKELFVKFGKHEVPHKRIWIPSFFFFFLKIRRTNLEAAFLNGIRCVAGALFGPACVFSFAIPSVPHGQPELFSSSVFRGHWSLSPLLRC